VGSEPYPGLRPYTTDDQDRFYGRESETRELLAQWRASRLLIVHGPSGVGKSSLINVAVARLAESDRVVPVGRVSFGSTFPTAALPEHNPYELALMCSWSPSESPTRLASLSLTEFVRRRWPSGSSKTQQSVFVAIDQFEELFGGPSNRHRFREQFVDSFVDIMHSLPELHLMVCTRDQALARLEPLARRLDVDDGRRLRLHPLGPVAALEAVTGPLARTGRRYAPGVAERLVHDLRSTRLGTGVALQRTVVADRVEPAHLQVVCSSLWQSLPEQIVTISNAPVSTQHVEQALTAFCARTVGEVAFEHRLLTWELLDWLSRAFVAESGIRIAVRQGATETEGMPNAVVRALEDRRVLGSTARPEGIEYSLSSDRLIEPVRAARLVPDQAGREPSPGDLLRKAADALTGGALDLAARHAEEAILAGGDYDARATAEAESVLGNVAYYRGQLDVAAAHYRRAATYFEVLQDAAAAGLQLMATGRLLGAIGNYSEALGVMQAAVARLGGDHPVQVELARVLWSAGQLEAATAVLSTVLALAPDQAQALADRGQIRVDRDDPVSALDDLDSLIRLRPDIGRRADVRAARALALAHLNRSREAVAEVAAALADDPDSGPVLLHASGVARATGEPNRADALLRRARAARKPQLLPYQLTEVHRLLADSGSTPGPGT
jgi:tetratricopeptide (TPR) repeat protein